MRFWCLREKHFAVKNARNPVGWCFQPTIKVSWHKVEISPKGLNIFAIIDLIEEKGNIR